MHISNNLNSSFSLQAFYEKMGRLKGFVLYPIHIINSTIQKINLFVYHLLKKIRYSIFPSFVLKNSLRIEKDSKDFLSIQPLHILELVSHKLSLKDRQSLSNVNSSLYQNLTFFNLLDRIQIRSMSLDRKIYLLSLLHKQGKQVKALDLSYYGSYLSSNDLKIIISSCPHLQNLNIKKCSKLSINALITVIEKCPNLQDLNLGSCQQFSDEALITVAKECPNLQDLNLAGCNQFSEASLISVAKKCPNLPSLNLKRGNQFYNAAIIALAEKCPKLQSL